MRIARLVIDIDALCRDALRRAAICCGALCLGALCLGATASWAQVQPGVTERVDIGYAVIGVLEDSTDHGKMKGVIQRDTLVSIPPGVIGAAHATSPREPNDLRMTELGAATVLTLDHPMSDSISVFEIVLMQPELEDARLQVGDIVIIPSDVPALARRSIFFELASKGVAFVDLAQSPYFTWTDLLLSDGDSLEQILYERIRSDVISSADRLETGGEYDIALSGRFAGTTLKAALATVTTGDLSAFFSYVNSYPFGYMGQNFRTSESMAGWMQSGGPAGQSELRDRLMSYPSVAAQDSVIDAYNSFSTDDLSDGVYIRYWNKQIENWATDNEIDKAYRLSDIVRRLADRYDDPSMRGQALFHRAKVAEADGDPLAAISMYQEMILIFDDPEVRQNADSDEAKMYAYSLNNYGDALRELGRYEEALNTSELAIREKTSWPPSEDNLRSLATSHLGRAWSLRDLGRLDEALAETNTADSLYQLGTSRKSQIDAAQAATERARILGLKGEYESAIAMFEDIETRFESVNYQEGIADTYDHIAFTYYSWSKDREALDYYHRAHELHLASNELSDAGYSKSQVAQTQWRLGDHDKAIESHLDAIRLKQEARHQSGEAYSWRGLGELYNDAGDPTSAIAAFQKASTIYESIGNKSGQSDVLDDLADLYSAEKDLKRAVQIRRQALEIRRALGLRLDIATSLNGLGRDYFELRDYENARKAWSESADVRREAGDRSGLVDDLSNLGMIAHFFDRDYSASIDLYDQAIALATELNNDFSLAWCYRGLASISKDKGDYQGALDLHTKALALFSETGDIVGSLIAIADIHRARGQFADARETLEQARDLAQEAKSLRDLGAVLTSLADLQRLEGDMKGALTLANEGLSIAKSVDNPWAQSNAHVTIGNILNQMGANPEAIANYELADSLAVAVQSETMRATPINNIGTIFYHQGDFARAQPFFEEALELQRAAKIDDEFTVILLGNIGEIHLEQDSLTQAGIWLEEALRMADTLGTDRIGVSTRIMVGRLRMKQERFAESEQLLREAETAARRVGEMADLILVQTTLGDLFVQTSRPEMAVQILDAAIEQASQLGLERNLWRPLALRGHALQNSGRAVEAINSYERSIATIDEIRKRLVGGDAASKTFSENRDIADAYESLIALLIQQGDVERAMAVLERSNNEQLRKQLGDLTVQFADSEKTAVVAEGKERKARVDQLKERVAKEKSSADRESRTDLIASLEQMVTVAESEYNGFVNTAVRQHADLRGHLTNSVNPIEFSRKKRNIPDDTAVIAYLVGQTQLFIFVATKSQVTAAVIPVGREKVHALVDSVYAVVSNSNSTTRRGAASRVGKGGGSYEESTADLYRLLIGPIENEIRNKRKLAIVPSGKLHRLPFQMLSPTGTSDGALFSQHTIFYLSDLDVFLQDKNEDELRVMAFADGSLHNAELEANEIAEIFPNSVVYAGAEATEDRAKAPGVQHNVLHFATHGILDFNNFDESYLQLVDNDAAGEDGMLTIGEIWSMSGLETYRLVTLSACETAVSDDLTNGWPINPANAFLTVGVPSVVASLWAVDDLATSILMQLFYSNLAEYGIAESMRMAQMELAATDEFAHPFYWAPFVAFGDWR